MNISAGSSGSSDSREKITSELKNVIREAEDLLKGNPQGNPRLAESTLQSAKDRIEANLNAMRKGLGQAQESILQRSRDAAERTDDYVQNHAWQAVGVGALAGLVLGLLMGRR